MSLKGYDQHKQSKSYFIALEHASHLLHPRKHYSLLDTIVRDILAPYFIFLIP